MARPTKFREEFCEQLIQHMEEGYSFSAFAGRLGVCRQTTYSWVQEHPSFAEAKEIAFEKSRFFWERQGLEGLWSVTEYDDNGKLAKSKSINATVYIFNKKNRFPDEWRDRRDEEPAKPQQGPTLSVTPEVFEAYIEKAKKK